MIWTEEKEAQIKQYKSILNRGRLVSSKAVADLFNEVFGTNIKPVSCATCVRNRILKIWRAYEEHLKEQEELKKQETLELQETHVPDVQADEVVEEPITPKKRAGRPKKKKETEE